MAPQRPANETASEDADPTGVTTIEQEITKVGEETPWPDRKDSGVVPGAGAPELDRLEDQYELYEEIGRGGMASVHLGRSIAPGVPRAVAIKVLNSQLASDPSFVAMFVDEARMAARVHHPNVVAPRDFVVRAAQGELCLVMEYLHGETLSQLLARAARKQRPASPSVAVAIMVGVLRGLHAAHEATTDEGAPLEMVHRDVSPQNIMVGSDGIARVLDFGVAKARTLDVARRRKERAGKPAYLAPEQIRFHDVDRRADIFAAGVVLWELLSGHRLFRHRDPRMVWVNILSGDIPPPSRFQPAVSPALDAAVLHAMERDPDRRYPDARAFARAITEAHKPASASEVADWVKNVSGEILARRAGRIAEIMAGQGSPAPAVKTTRVAALISYLPWVKTARDPAAVTPAPPLDMGELFRRTGRGRRWSILGLVLVAVAALAPSVSSPRAPSQWTAVSAANASQAAPRTAVAPPAKNTTVEVPVEKIEGEALAIDPVTESAPVTAPVTAPDSEPDSEPATVSATEESDSGGAATSAADAPTVARARRAVRPRAARPNGRATAVAAIRALHSSALAAYERADYEASRRQLRAALAAGIAAHLQNHPLAAATHVYLGMTLVDGFKQPQLGVDQFRQAQKIDPRSSRYVTPAMAAVFRAAVDGD